MENKQITWSTLRDRLPTLPQDIAEGKLQVILTHNGRVLGFLVSRTVAERIFPRGHFLSLTWRAFSYGDLKQIEGFQADRDFLLLRSPVMGAIAFVPPTCIAQLDFSAIG